MRQLLTVPMVGAIGPSGWIYSWNFNSPPALLLMPLLMVVVSPAGALVPMVSAASLGFLALLGAIGARVGGANVLRATARVTFWGAFAMALTAGIGKLFGTVI